MQILQQKNNNKKSNQSANTHKYCSKYKTAKIQTKVQIQILQHPQNPEDYEEEGAPTLRVNPPSSTNSSTLLIIGQSCVCV